MADQPTSSNSSLKRPRAIEDKDDEGGSVSKKAKTVTTDKPTGSKVSITRLNKELRTLAKLNPQEAGFEVIPDENNFYKWKVKLFGFPEDSALGRDLKLHKQRYGPDYVELEITFGDNFPWTPPFVRVVRPRFQFRTGHVTVGGSICMELLTSSGWKQATLLEGVLVSIRAEMVEGGARLEGTDYPYTEEEAKEAFLRVARQHGWEK